MPVVAEMSLAAIIVAIAEKKSSRVQALHMLFICNGGISLLMPLSFILATLFKGTMIFLAFSCVVVFVSILYRKCSISPIQLSSTETWQM